MSAAATIDERSQYLTFEVGEDLYAIGILELREIISFKSATRVPMAPRSIRGLINLRGSAVPVVDSEDPRKVIALLERNEVGRAYAEKLAQLYRDAGITPQQGLRLRGTDAAERGLPEANDAAVLAAMAADPILIERPLVETDKGVRLCRPQDVVLEIL